MSNNITTFLAFTSCMFLLVYCTKDEPEIDFSDPLSFNCNSSPLICTRPDSLGPFGEMDCDNGGISSFHECIASTDFSDPSDDCLAAVKAKVDICFLMQVDPNDVEAGFMTDMVLSDQDCDGGGLTNYEECVNGFDPIRENDADELNNLVDMNEIEAFLARNYTRDVSSLFQDSMFVELHISKSTATDTFRTIRTESGVVCLIPLDTIGETPTAQSTINYNFSSSYFDKRCLDLSGNCVSSDLENEQTIVTNESLTSLVSDLVFGLQDGLSYMTAGTRGIILIPSLQAYGSAGAFDIPSYSVLLFDVELVSFE